MLVAGVVSPVALISAPTLVAVTRFERRRAAAECDPAGMNHLGDANLRTWTMRFMALLAADTKDQLAWLGERELETKDVVEELELLCRVSEGLTERGVFDPEDLHHLRVIGHRLGEIDAGCRVGLWHNALVADPAWDDIRSFARRFLLNRLGDWRQPLPRPVGPHTNDR
ncbi:hypothetical protein KBZ00_34940 [Streptomyces sp. RK31]|uniref:hypothetical protein n=1 Tax=unclassified Streptomyces TaxID=2593676 RepID=UPI00187D6474|nr:MULTISPECIES: hypothetical protein [unclassified Streptomyces]MBQ0976250.1 hypothetical protein [Streptomyces sp. RK31]